MRKLSALLMLITLIFACGPKKKLPAGAPEYIKKEKLLEQVQAHALQFKKLRLSGRGTFIGGGQSQSFRFDIRLLNDSLIWINISDPLLGISLARGMVHKGEVSYYNALDKSYFRGSPESLQARLGFDFSFRNLFPLLSANAMQLGKAVTHDFVPGHYVLRDFDPTGKQAPNPRQVAFKEVYLLPEIFRPSKVEIKEPINGRVYTGIYGNYKKEGEMLFPEKITLQYVAKDEVRVELDISRVERDAEFGFPFKIPPRYERQP